MCSFQGRAWHAAVYDTEIGLARRGEEQVGPGTADSRMRSVGAKMGEGMVKTDDAVLVLVDIQGRLAEIMHERDRLFANLDILARGARVLNLPVLWMEQSPGKMGPTVSFLRELLRGREPLAKTSFSCWGEPSFVAALKAEKRRSVLLAGIETHVCVYQTSADLVREGYEVNVVADAVSSRTAGNKTLGLERIKACGAGLTSVETALFELLRSADHPAFREILALVK